MSAKPDGGSLIGNHVGHRSSLPTVTEDDEDSPETSSTPPDETTPLTDDVDGPTDSASPGGHYDSPGGPQTGDDEDDVDEPVAFSSSEATLSDTEAKEAVPDGGPPAALQVAPTEDTATGTDN